MKGKREAYRSFALVYDDFMEGVPYESWLRQTKEILLKKGISQGIVCDLGCGTGILTRGLAKEGYDMIGIDSSPDMLAAAVSREEETDSDILYLCQDLRRLDLYGTCRAMICRCDTINYILSLEELVQVFSLVNLYLDPGGVFIFDCNTVYKYREILGDSVFAENREEASFIWENHFDEETGINEYDLTLFIREKEGEERFRRVEECYLQRAYSLSQLRYACERAGLSWEAVVDADTQKEIGSKTERYLITATEKGKGN